MVWVREQQEPAQTWQILVQSLSCQLQQPQTQQRAMTQHTQDGKQQPQKQKQQQQMQTRRKLHTSRQQQMMQLLMQLLT
jgi:hypothetical protein